MPATPEFVRWTLVRGCEIRTEFDRWEEPAWAHRQLVPLRAYSEAVRAGRLHDGICVAPGVTAQTPPEDATGFRAAEVLEPYGGREEVAARCEGCVANVYYTGTSDTEPSLQNETPLAGCFGLVDVSQLGETLHESVAKTLAQPRLDSQWRQHFLPTQPQWYSLWISRSPSREQRELLLELFKALLADSSDFEPLRPLALATAASLRPLPGGETMPLRVEANTTGRVEGRKWFVTSHCSRCKAASIDRGLEEPCPVCGSTAQAIPARTRCSAGKRPYWPLVSFLGQEQTAHWLRQYLPGDASS